MVSTALDPYQLDMVRRQQLALQQAQVLAGAGLFGGMQKAYQGGLNSDFVVVSQDSKLLLLEEI